MNTNEHKSREIGPGGAKGCSHGWSNWAAQQAVAEPVVNVAQTCSPRRGEGIAHLELDAPHSKSAQFAQSSSRQFTIHFHPHSSVAHCLFSKISNLKSPIPPSAFAAPPRLRVPPAGVSVSMCLCASVPLWL